MNVFKEAYITIIDWVKDLRETRKQLIWVATFLWIWSVLKGVDAVSLGIIGGLLTITYTFYFAGKNQEEKNKHEKSLLEMKGFSPSGGDRNPDE